MPSVAIRLIALANQISILAVAFLLHADYQKLICGTVFIACRVSVPFCLHHPSLTIKSAAWVFFQWTASTWLGIGQKTGPGTSYLFGITSSASKRAEVVPKHANGWSGRIVHLLTPNFCLSCRLQPLLKLFTGTFLKSTTVFFQYPSLFLLEASRADSLQWKQVIWRMWLIYKHALIFLIIASEWLHGKFHFVFALWWICTKVKIL